MSTDFLLDLIHIGRDLLDVHVHVHVVSIYGAIGF
jgi:hypothetical protein